MSLSQITRKALNMSQKAFGVWLGEQVKGEKLVQPHIADFDRGRYVLGKKYRHVCAPIAAKYLIKQSSELSKSAFEKLLCESLL